ncbi:hypothetical protein SAMN05443144_102229 [Fodinibius roseus]|uniref:Uncharacterized protein n=1 Tax=Fodinibius roseus TaxID=1194090 RepID=A0A1M4V8L7_9BACT|nr:hypothetical protein SAMN05443144_102229 [Fodinibius roseus]
MDFFNLGTLCKTVLLATLFILMHPNPSLCLIHYSFEYAQRSILTNIPCFKRYYKKEGALNLADLSLINL